MCARSRIEICHNACHSTKISHLASQIVRVADLWIPGALLHEKIQVMAVIFNIIPTEEQVRNVLLQSNSRQFSFSQAYKA